MFKSQLEPPSDNFMQTQIFVENIFDTVKKAREAKAARSLAETKIIANELSPSKRKKSRKNAKGKKVKPTPTKRKQRKPRTPKEPKRTPRKYTKRAKTKPQNDIDDEEAAFILSSISQRSFDSFYNRFNHSNSVVIPLEPQPTSTPVAQHDHAAAYHHVLLDHNYWVPQPPQPSPPTQDTQIIPTVATSQNLSEVNNNSFDSTSTNAVKKRWLRQATTESSSPTVTPPETSPNDMLKAPLKKRKLVHEVTHEINIDQTSPSPFVCTIKHEEQNPQPLNMTIIKPEVPYTIDKLKEIHEKIEMEFGGKGNIIQSSQTASVIQKVNNLTTNDHMQRRYDEIVIKSPENIYDNRRIIQDHQIKIELPDHQPPAINIQFHQNHNFNIKPEVFDTKPAVECLQMSPLDTKIQKIVGESLFIKADTVTKNSPQIQIIEEGFQKMHQQQHQPNLMHKFIHNGVDQCNINTDQNLQIIYNSDNIEPQRCQQIVHESIFKFDNNVYKIIENVPRVDQQQLSQPLQIVEKKKTQKITKAPTNVKKIRTPKVQKKQTKKIKKSPQKSPKKIKNSKSPTKTKSSPIKIDSEFIKNFADIEDVPLKFRQNLSNTFEIEKLIGKNTNVKGELKDVIEVVNTNSLKFEENYPEPNTPLRKKLMSSSDNQIEEQASNKIEKENNCDVLHENHRNSVVEKQEKNFSNLNKSDLTNDGNVESTNNDTGICETKILDNIIEPMKIDSENLKTSEFSSENLTENPTTYTCKKLAIESNDLINCKNSCETSILLGNVKQNTEIDEMREVSDEVTNSLRENKITLQNDSDGEILSNTLSEVKADVECKSSIEYKCKNNILSDEKSKDETKESSDKEQKVKIKKSSFDDSDSCLEAIKIKTEIVEIETMVDTPEEAKTLETSKTIKKEEQIQQSSNLSEVLNESTTEKTSPPQINQQVASILEKVISRTIKSDQEVPSIEAITSDEEDDTQYRESVEEFHKDTLERLIQANKRFYRENFANNLMRSGRSFDYDDHRRSLKTSVSFEPHYPNHHYQNQNQHHNYPPVFNRSISERWNGSYGSFHYDKIHHREPTSTYSMYRAQKASQMDRWNSNNNTNSHHQTWNNRVEIQQPVLTPQHQLIVTPTDVTINQQSEALKNAASESFGGLLKEKITPTVSILPKTKTASSDPRLNPSLVQDVKKDELSAPKKKLSLDQYRKRKSLTSITPLTTPEDMSVSKSKSPSPTSHLSPAFDPSIAAAAATG